MSRERVEKDYIVSNLIVAGVDLDPKRATAILGGKPTRTLRRGEATTRELPNGTHEEIGVTARAGFWRRPIPKRFWHWDVVSQIEYWCDRLEVRSSGVQMLISSGCTVTIDLYASSGGVVLMRLEPGLLNRLADLGVSVRIGVYNSATFGS